MSQPACFTSYVVLPIGVLLLRGSSIRADTQMSYDSATQGLLGGLIAAVWVHQDLGFASVMLAA